MDIRRLVGQNVRLFRGRLGISQEELAFRSGLHRTYVSGVERGIRNPTVVIIKRLASALGVEPPALLAAKQGRSAGQGR
jgi:transcriptional regulator with XRE-family HTH domain